jgi:adenylate cyclase
MAKDKIEVRKLGLLVAKGKKQAVGVYELLAKKDELDETLAKLVAKFESTWDIYAKRGFVEAKRGFEDCLKIVPDDGPSLAYIEQCDHFTENSPPEDWTGEWIQLTK